MAVIGREGKVNVAKFVDYRRKIQRHRSKDYPVLSVQGKNTIVIHHGLTDRKQPGANAEGYARFHVETHGWPSVGYHYVIEADGTIKWCNGIELRAYHAGNHNNYTVGICLVGDFRDGHDENPTKAQEESLRKLVKALQKKYPQLKDIVGHNDLPGYEWKQCPEFDYMAVINGKDKDKPKSPAKKGDTYEVQEGDTFYSIAKGEKGLSVRDLIDFNPDVNPRKLRVGQEIKLTGKKRTKKEREEVNYKGYSLVDYLNLIGEDPSFANRRKLARKHGITPYRGKASQNLKLLNKLQGGGTTQKKSSTKKKSSSKSKSDGKAIVPYPGHLIEKGSEGKDVERIQRAVKVKADGIFGTKTEEAVMAYQKRHGLKVDGVVGPKTWNVMF